MNNPIGQFTDELVELGKDTGKTFVRDVVKGVPQSAKSQILGTEPAKLDQSKKTSLVTDKPIPSKQAMSQLSQATSQLQTTKLRQVRKRLEEMRLKATEQKSLAGQKGTGPEISVSKPKAPVDNAVQKMLKNARSTGEVRGGGG